MAFSDTHHWKFYIGAECSSREAVADGLVFFSCVTRAWQYIHLYLPIQLRVPVSTACEQVWRSCGGGRVSNSLIPWSRQGPPFLTTPQVPLSGVRLTVSGAHRHTCPASPLSHPPVPISGSSGPDKSWPTWRAGSAHGWPNELDRCTRACVPASCRTSPRGQVAVPGFLFTKNVGVHCCGPHSQVPSLSQLSLSALTTPQGWF